MADDYMGGDEAAPEETPDEGGGDAGAGMDKSETTLVPLSMFPEKPEVGKKCSFEVVHVYEDEAEVKYSHSEDDAAAEAKEPMHAEEGTAGAAFDQAFPKE